MPSSGAAHGDAAATGDQPDGSDWARLTLRPSASFGSSDELHGTRRHWPVHLMNH